LSLIGFHRVLIGTGIVFCFGFAAWEALLWRGGTGGSGSLLLGLTFAALGTGLALYLGRLRHYVGYENRDS